MAIISSHTLDSVLGSHASGIEVELFRLEAGGERVRVLRTRTDEGGRLSAEVELNAERANDTYELVFHTGDYFTAHSVSGLGSRIMNEVVVRFSMPDPNGRYHMPMMLSPNSYSVWWSN
ncbi:MAG: hydroxyisourate hydrolase [Gammaproteobacteria bacterium]|nr:hydroxyisourate hydrolase [Gammaproteobacteria bacterium]MDH3465398.1 hydroxyisourate hydrolase [Gammaproteobacteria bacterium]